jgi:hypothetical protein
MIIIVSEALELPCHVTGSRSNNPHLWSTRRGYHFRSDQSCCLGFESSVSLTEDAEKEPVGVYIRSVNSANASMQPCVDASMRRCVDALIPLRKVITL